MVNIKEAKEDKATVVGIIFIGMGSSWYQGSDDVKVAVQCAEICKQDWKHLFKFERNHAFPVNLYDLTNCEKGWYATHRGVLCRATNKELPRKKLLYIVK